MINAIVGTIFTILGGIWLFDEYKLSRFSSDNRIFIRICLTTSLIVIGILSCFNLI